MKTAELRQNRAALIGQAREILDLVEAEDREITQDEQAQYDAIMADVEKMAGNIKRYEDQEALEKSLAQPVTEPMQPDPSEDGRDLSIRETPEYRSGFMKWCVSGPEGLAPEEIRALQAESDIYGGYLVTPLQFVNDLIKAVDNMVYVQQLATVHLVTSAESLGAASLDNDPADPIWTKEIGTGDEDSTMSFGDRELSPYPLAKRIKISRKLIRKVPDSETLVRDRLAYKFAVTAENAYLNGTGAGQPLGVFVASDDGIGTGRDVSTGNTTTEIRFDGLIEALYSLKGQYRRSNSSAWMFHRDGVKQIRKLKDGEGRYIWEPSVRVGEPDRIMNLPVYESEYAPNTFTTGLYVGLVGDWKNYWIAIALDMEIQRLVELYAATNQIGLIGRLEADGMPVLAEAFARVKLA